MTEVLVVALKSFQLGKEIKSRRSNPFVVTRSEFVQLKARGLVAEAPGNDIPKAAAGTSPSASPVVPASLGATANGSEVGAKRSGRPRKGSSA